MASNSQTCWKRSSQSYIYIYIYIYTHTHTHYTPQGVVRLDCMHVSPNLRGRKTGVETVLAAFTDHLAVCLRITLDAPLLRLGRGRCKMNVKLLEETTFRDQLQQDWSRWKQQGKKYQNSVTWWECYAKHTLRSYQNTLVTSCS